MAILKADSRLRRKVLLLYIAFAVLGLGTIYWLTPLFEEHVKEQGLREAKRSVQFLIVLLFMPVLGMAYYMRRLAKKVLASGQCPPPNTRVLRDTEILEGDAARRQGQSLLILSAMIGAVALVGIVYLPYLAGKVFEGIDRLPPPHTSLQPTEAPVDRGR